VLLQFHHCLAQYSLPALAPHSQQPALGVKIFCSEQTADIKMAQTVAKYAAKKMLAKQLKEYKDKDPAGPYVSTTLQQRPSLLKSTY
jgi:hypothetical protein